MTDRPAPEIPSWQMWVVLPFGLVPLAFWVTFMWPYFDWNNSSRGNGLLLLITILGGIFVYLVACALLLAVTSWFSTLFGGSKRS